MLLESLNLDKQQEPLVKEVIEKLAGRTHLLMGIVDIELNRMEWLCNVSSGFRWVKPPKDKPVLMTDFIYSEDLSRAIGDINYFKSYELEEFETIYRIHDRFDIFHWSYVRLIPIKYDPRLGYCTHVLIRLVHMTDAIRNSQFDRLLAHEQKARQQRMFEKRFTAREKEILLLIGDAKTDAEIADELLLSELTVATHRRNLLRKLNLRNKVELVKFVYENGLK